MELPVRNFLVQLLKKLKEENQQKFNKMTIYLKIKIIFLINTQK